MPKLRNALWALPLILTLSSCSDAPKVEKAKEPEKPAAPATGRQAFQQMYPMARSWAVDAKPLQLQSINITESKSTKGTAGAWQAIFVSQALGKSRSYTYSVTEAPGNLHQGVFAGPEQSYSGGPHGQSFPFEIAAIKTDSDQAFDLAAEKSQDYIKKHPEIPISYLLEQTRRFPDLTWRVIWGDSLGASEYSVFVDATMGKFLEKVH